MKIAIPALLGSSLLLMSGAALAQYGGTAGGQYGTSGGYAYSGGSMPSSSSDDNIGLEAQIVFGVERTMGVFWVHDTVEGPDEGVNEKTTIDANTIALFGNQGPTPVTIPRLALDYFVVEGFSLGASFIYWRFGGTTTEERGTAPSAERDTATLSTVVIHPRLGYSFIFDETFALWLRGGITWSNFNVTTPLQGTGATGQPLPDTEANLSAFDLSFDVPLVISPIENFAILIGPFVDIGLSGTSEDTRINMSGTGTVTVEQDHTLTAFGLSVGISGYY